MISGAFSSRQNWWSTIKLGAGNKPATGSHGEMDLAESGASASGTH
jgi:hypothetical protein